MRPAPTGPRRWPGSAWCGGRSRRTTSARTTTSAWRPAPPPAASSSCSSPAAPRGWKRVEHRVELHGFLISSQLYGEDAQDDFYTLRDALFAKIHADPACGSGGFENLGFQVGEGELLEWDLAQAEAKAGQTRGYLFIKTIAVEYVQA
jgi:hypothetical protein